MSRRGPAEEVKRWINYAAGEAAEIKKSALATANSAVGTGLSQFFSVVSVAVQETKFSFYLAKNLVNLLLSLSSILMAISFCCLGFDGLDEESVCDS